MGIKKKEHRKKVAARNAKIKADMKRAEKIVQEFIARGKAEDARREQIQSATTLGFGPVSAIQAATSEKNKN